MPVLRLVGLLQPFAPAQCLYIARRRTPQPVGFFGTSPRSEEIAVAHVSRSRVLEVVQGAKQLLLCPPTRALGPESLVEVLQRALEAERSMVIGHEGTQCPNSLMQWYVCVARSTRQCRPAHLRTVSRLGMARLMANVDVP
jgi:hypothetical protein